MKFGMRLFFGLLLIFPGVTPAQEVLTLDDCIELALQNRASIIAARGFEDLAKADQRAALGAFLPNVDAGYNYSETRSRDITSDVQVPDEFSQIRWDAEQFNPETGTWEPAQVEASRTISTKIEEIDLPDQDRTNKSLDFTARMSILDFSNVFDYMGARSSRAKARLDVIASEQDLILAVKTAYYAYLANVENVAVQDQAVERSEEQLKLINSKYELGSASKSDVLKQKVQSGNDKLAQLSARNGVTTSRAALAYTIGIDPRRNVEFSTDYTERQFKGSLEDAISYGLEHRPSVLSLQKDVDATRSYARARRAGYLPTLSGFASLAFTDGTRGDTVTFNFSDRSTTIGFQVNWNIFDGFFRERQITSARVAHNNAKALLADERNLTSSAIQTAFLDIEQLQQQKQVAEETVASAQEDMNITQEKYNLGAATILDLLVAQVSLRDAQVALIRVDFDLNAKVAELENAMGKM